MGRDHSTRPGGRRACRCQLVQCSLNGEDPYWGRVSSELGVSGGGVSTWSRWKIAYNGVVACRSGIVAVDDPDGLAATMQSPEIHIECDLHAGPDEASMLFTDLSHVYIDENRGTS